MNGRPDWWESQNRQDAKHTAYKEAQKVKEMMLVTSYELLPGDLSKVIRVAMDRGGAEADPIVIRVHRVCDLLGLEASGAQTDAVRRAIIAADNNSSCGLSSETEAELIVKHTLAQFRRERTVKVTPFVREYTAATVRKVKTIKKGGVGR